MTTKTCQCGKPPKRSGTNLLAVIPAEISRYWQKKGYVIPDKDGVITRTFRFGENGKNGIYIVPSGSPVWADHDAFCEAFYAANDAFKKAAKIGRNKQSKAKKND